jgi:hypothetical protein
MFAPVQYQGLCYDTDSSWTESASGVSSRRVSSPDFKHAKLIRNSIH